MVYTRKRNRKEKRNRKKGTKKEQEQTGEQQDENYTMMTMMKNSTVKPYETVMELQNLILRGPLPQRVAALGEIERLAAEGSRNQIVRMIAPYSKLEAAFFAFGDRLSVSHERQWIDYYKCQDEDEQEESQYITPMPVAALRPVLTGLAAGAAAASLFIYALS